MNLLTRILKRKDQAAMRLPPPREPDPEIVASAMQATRVLSRADVVLERRRRLNLELTRAEEVIRSIGDSRATR